MAQNFYETLKNILLEALCDALTIVTKSLAHNKLACLAHKTTVWKNYYRFFLFLIILQKLSEFLIFPVTDSTNGGLKQSCCNFTQPRFSVVQSCAFRRYSYEGKCANKTSLVERKYS